MTPDARARTLPALFEASVERYGDHAFAWEKSGDRYASRTYADVRRDVRRCAAGLLALGVRRGDRLALMSEGRALWIVAELGILYAGGVNVPLSVKIEEPGELKFRLAHAGCTMAIVSATQAPKIRGIRPGLPGLGRVILLDGAEGSGEGACEMAFAALLGEGDRFMAAHPGAVEDSWQSVGEHDPANICYTSGTVADPKGIILTHRNYTANIAQSVTLYPLPDWFCTLLILPWDHSFAHTDGIYALAACGGSIASVQAGRTPMETLRNIPGNIREVRPTFLLSVPALAKNFRKNIEAGVRAKGGAARLLFRAGLAVAYAHDGDGWDRGRGWRGLLAPLRAAFDALIFRKVREGFGGRLEYFIGGGALLDIELQKFFSAIGIPMYQGYGLTEAAPVISANTPARHRFGSSGMPAPDLELRICDEAGRDLPPGEQGEIVVRGENVMAGYWDNPEATAAALREGWLYTGDIGYVDRDGFLFVLGREKSLLIGHDGEKYSPEGIEEYIVGHSPFIDQIMLYNNQSPSTVALLVPNRDAIDAWLTRHRHARPPGPAGAEPALRLLEREIAKFRSGGEFGGLFPDRWLPSAIGVLDEPFTEQNRLLNSTLKMVRGKIVSALGARLEYLFTPEGRNADNGPNRRAIASLFARTLVVLVTAAACIPRLALAQADTTTLVRRYTEGEELAYRMTATNQGKGSVTHYEALASGVVKRDTDGTMYEEYSWSDLRVNDARVTLPPASRAFRERLSLSPSFRLSIPALAHLHPGLIGPVVDLLTFYADVQIAMRQSLRQSGDHVYVNDGNTNSWADGKRILTGEDAIDFDITLADVNTRDSAVTLIVRHVPPANPAIALRAPWMRVPVAGTPNNWVQVARADSATYVASVGRETFDATITLRLGSGKVLTATLDNHVQVLERVCTDSLLESCGSERRYTIRRRVEIE